MCYSGGLVVPQERGQLLDRKVGAERIPKL